MKIDRNGAQTEDFFPFSSTGCNLKPPKFKISNQQFDALLCICKAFAGPIAIYIYVCVYICTALSMLGNISKVSLHDLLQMSTSLLSFKVFFESYNNREKVCKCM